MEWIYVILGGLIAGIIAKSIVPGNEPGGWLIDIVIGIVGGILGKLLLPLIGLPAQAGALWNLIVAVIGAVILLVIYHAVTGGAKKGAA